MGLVNYKEILNYAMEHKFAVGAFNSMNMETLQAIVSAAEEKNTPLIVQTYHEHTEFAGAEYMQALASVAAKNSKVKIAMGLDHGQSYEQAKKCIECGYSGVMIDLASSDYDYNVEQTQKVVELAHSKGVSVEAEIGVIVNADCTLEEIAKGYTDPEIARRFARDTKIDCIAVSIGTAHGLYKYSPKINFDLLKELVAVVDCPIVVHGGSNTPDDDIVEMVRLGIAKLNIGTDFFVAYNEAILQELNEYGVKSDPTKIMSAGRNAVKKIAMQKIDLLNRFRI